MSNKYKKLHAELVDKYDRNTDALISLDEYLDIEISKGPRADEGNIDYTYNSSENIYNYFLILFKKIKYFKIMCIPNVTIKYFKAIIRAATAYNIVTNEIYIPNKVKNEITKCSKKANHRFIFFTFIVILTKKDTMTHANMIIIDLYKKTVERFEPYGKSMGFQEYYKERKIKSNIDKSVKEYIMPAFGLDKFKYLSPTDISPNIGIQRITDAYCGMCVTISMMYLHMRIMNPDVEQRKIIKYFTSMSKSELKKKILKYARHVERKLKDDPKIVNYLNNELYSKLYYMK
jgi:hypothetical protein